MSGRGMDGAGEKDVEGLHVDERKAVVVGREPFLREGLGDEAENDGICRKHAAISMAHKLRVGFCVLFAERCR